jgi:hypothetical protein
VRLAPLILLGACYRSPPETTPIANKSEIKEPEGLTMTVHSVGPIDGTTKATLVDLRKLLVGYEVRPVNDGSLQYDVYKNGERLMYVVPDDQAGYVFNIHVVSSHVAITGHAWRVGRTFTDAAHLTTCECWGPNPTCFAEGDHIAVNFDRECEGLTEGDRRALRVLDGLVVKRVIWSPVAFGEASGEDND